ETASTEGRRVVVETRLEVMLTPSREMLFCTSRAPAPMKYWPPEVLIPVRLLKPVRTPGVSAAARRTSRQCRGRSPTVFCLNTSLMLASSLALGAASTHAVHVAAGC